MKKLFSKYVCVFLFVIILFSFFPAKAAIAATEESEVYYGEAYYDLQSEDHRLAYRMIEEGIASLSPRIEFEGIVQINYKQMKDILRAVCVDHPQYFWFLETGSFIYGDVNKGGNIISFDPTYILDGQEVAVGSQELADAMYAFHTKVQEIIRSIPVNFTTEYEIALYLHDYLADHVTYTLEGEHPSAYAALIHGEAACYGYSKAYQCLLNAAGIRARTITGDSPDENGELSGHAWNQVWLDGKCYYTDVTWDDFEEFTLHNYFAISLQKISEDHFADDEFILPECSHDLINYYSLSAGNGVARWNEHTTAQTAAACFRLDEIGQDGAVFTCEVQYASSGFLNWLGWNYRDIFKHMGLDDAAELYYYDRNDVFHLIAIDPKYQTDTAVITQITLNAQTLTLTGPDTCFQIQPIVQADVGWTPNLIYRSSDETVATVDEFGLITAVSEGTAVVTVSSPDGSAESGCTVTVESAPEHVHTMRLFTAKQPTCIQDGYEAHYLCTGCGIRFADEMGTQPLLKTAEFIFPAAGHQEYTWRTELNYHVHKCACGYEEPNTMANHADADADGKCDTCNGWMPLNNSANPGTTQGNAAAGQKKALAGWLIPAVAGIAILLSVVVNVIIRNRRRNKAITPFGG